MALIENWLPPTREHWELVVYLFQFFPIITAAQWCLSWYGAGKTSGQSRFNIPGKIAWLTMEAPGMCTMLYVINKVSTQEGIETLPWQNKIMAGLFVTHYLYRAILGPFLNPSMSPIHVLVWAFAICFQVTNGLSIGGWLGGYARTTDADWQAGELGYKTEQRMALGVIVWALGLLGNIYHDDELREIRRVAERKEKKRAEAAQEKGKSGKVERVYMIPENGLFRWILFPHYFCEWIEWGGFWIVGGCGCTPARNFLLNEIATMLPRAVQGKRWYIARFGKEKVGGKKAIIPGVW